MRTSMWMLHADNDPLYAEWLERVADLCSHLLDISFEDLIEEAGFDSRDSFYRDKMYPEKFVAECVIQYLESEHGGDMIFGCIAEAVIWGKSLEDLEQQ